MALVKQCFLAVVLVVAARTVQALTEDDYPEVALPGIVVPGDDSFESIPNADPCCLPDKWQGNLTGQTAFSGGRVGGKLKLISNLAIFVDKPGNQIAGKSDEGGRFRNKTVGFVMIFKDGNATLFAFSLTDQKCKKINIRNATFKPQCIPANSTMREINLGLASGGLKVQAWSFHAKSPQDRRGMKTFVSGTFLVGDQCTPVAFEDRGVIRRGRPHTDENLDPILFNQDDDEQDVDKRGRGGGMKFVSNIFYSNVKPSIDDPVVFTPPTFCNATLSSVSREALLNDDDTNSFNDIIERFVSF